MVVLGVLIMGLVVVLALTVLVGPWWFSEPSLTGIGPSSEEPGG